jgi:predicted dithiol-disulfide oxidoreductase (DUF899 family)
MSEQEGFGDLAPSMTEPLGDLHVVDEQAWRAALEQQVDAEKAHMKARDRLIAGRRRLPMTEVSTDYRFVGPDGEVDLLDLFEGRRQLITYRFFFGPDVENWPTGSCSGCASFADQVTHPAHLAARDTTLVFLTAAPVDHIERLRRRMGWEHLPFFSLPDDRFADDFDVRDYFGVNVFLRVDDRAYRTFFLNGRGVEELGSVFSFLDLTPLGRQETWQEVPNGRPQGDAYTWWRLHDHYGDVAAPYPPRIR